VKKADGKKAVVIDYSSLGQPSKISGKTYKLIVYAVCNKRITKESSKPVLISSNKTTFEVMIEVDNACMKVYLSVIWEFIDKYPIFFAIGLAIFGVIIGAFGKPMWNITVFLLLNITITAIILIIIYKHVVPFNKSECFAYFMLVLSLVDIIVAYFVTSRQSAGFILLGVWFGASFTILFKSIILHLIICAFLIYKTRKKDRVNAIVLSIGLLIISSIYMFWANEVTFWVSLAGTSALCGLSAYFLKDLLITFVTAFVGAYITVRSITLPLADFPNEYDIYKHIIVAGNLEVSD